MYFELVPISFRCPKIATVVENAAGQNCQCSCSLKLYRTYYYTLALLCM